MKRKIGVLVLLLAMLISVFPQNAYAVAKTTANEKILTLIKGKTRKVTLLGVTGKKVRRISVKSSKKAV